tara:strand:+ start:3960 stop:4913 length:954 start_codon:yes stop_codon:yes gene_type:complete
MAFISKFPTTTFTLPDGSVVSSINILKTFRFSEDTLKNNELFLRKYGVTTNKVENLSHELYGDKPSFYWMLLYLNGIDSFSSCPIRQSKFESELPITYPGKVYYVKNAIYMTNVKEGDLIILYTTVDEVLTWRTAGIVKEYDKKFRRIVLYKEYDNVSNTVDFQGASSTFYDTSMEVRRKNVDSWEPIISHDNGGFTVGRVENETDKILGMYDGGLNQKEISPYYIIDGDDFDGVSYDFSATGITSGSVLYKLSSEASLSSPMNNLYYHTINKEEIKKNTEANTIKYFSPERTFQVNSFVTDLLNTQFKRGRTIKVT